MSRSFTLPAWGLLLGVSGFAQTQSFNVGQWFFGKNITADLPSGVTDLTDYMWSSEGHTCPIVIVSGKASLVCRDNVAGGPFNTVITEGDARLGNLGRLAIPTTFASGPGGAPQTGRYISSAVRPGPNNLYFTTVTTSSLTPFYNHVTAFRYQNYQTVQRVLGAGDTVTIKEVNEAGSPTLNNVTLSAAGPMDQNSDGTEFIYVEGATSGSTATNFYALCQIVSPGVLNALYIGRLTATMIDTPWGMGGFAFDHTADHGGVLFWNGYPPSVLDRMDLNIQGGPGPYPVAIQGCLCPVFPPPGVTFVPNLLLSAFFRSSVDLTSFYLSWGNIPSGAFQNVATPPQFLTQGQSPLPAGTGPPGNGWTNYYLSTVGQSSDTALGTFAASGNLLIAGVLPFSTSSYALQHGGAAWPIQSLLLYDNGTWNNVLTAANLPDVSNGQKAFYQGVTVHGCDVEFATKQNVGAIDGSGAFYAMYRLFRPCLTSASLNATTRQLVVTGVNLADQATAVYLQAPGATTLQGPYTVTNATSTEVDATVSSFVTGSQVIIQVDGAVQSDPIAMTVTGSFAPIISNLTDVNGNLSQPVSLKLMTLWGAFACATAATQTVNYPTSLGNCTVNLENGNPVPLLYTSNGQINLLLPSGMSVGPHQVTVTRTDANGTFTSGAFPFNTFLDGPVEFFYNGNVIVQVVRNGQAVLITPPAPVHPGEYFTFYVTGVNVNSLPTSVTVGGVAAQFAQAFVSWAQGLLQVNVLVPSGASGSSTVVFGDAPPFNITVQ